ncbi:hypothetical protein POM88_024626 [Heracleum sosnowskyi]|uniref:F-box associated beta-propeller type 1 domain-containing protein n=1 Tax=Heracleum sosnowskyi TaxID=360622 RepID=A0AAD8MM86_9APIA|nr:hypothetical protein POM88_024626 [Heracleum sosnowskyi]
MYNFTATEELADRSLQTLLSDKEFLGSCNGLVALWKAAKLDEVEDEIFLWNPTTREIKKIPKASNILIPRVLVQNCLLGFGYDHVNDDYKVMRTCRYPDRIVVSVYSLKNNSWARAEDMSTSICLYGNFGVSANGSLYWIGEGNVVAFDLVVHSHRELQFPAGVDKKNAKRDFFEEGGFKSEQLTTEKDIKYAVEKVMERAKKKKGSFG